MNALFIVGTLGTLITPAMLESWSRLHWSPTQLGAVAAIELAGLAIGSLSGLYWQQRWNWRHVAIAALLVALLANAACVMESDFAVVCALRGSVGMAGGLLAALYSAVLANSRSPGRIIAVTTFIQIGVEASVIFSSTSVFEQLGDSGLFISMSLLFAALVPFLFWLPAQWPDQPRVHDEAPSTASSSLRAYPLLLSFLPFIVVQTGVFTFLAEFGHLAANLPSTPAMRAISISVLLSALGSVGAWWLDMRIGLRRPIAGAIAIMVLALVGMTLGSTSRTSFTVYISLLQMSWIFLNCYLYSALIDANNLLVPAATPLSTAGSAVGASAMGYVLEHGGLAGSLFLTVGCMVLTAILTIPFIGTRVVPVSPPKFELS